MLFNLEERYAKSHGKSVAGVSWDTGHPLSPESGPGSGTYNMLLSLAALLLHLANHVLILT